MWVGFFFFHITDTQVSRMNVFFQDIWYSSSSEKHCEGVVLGFLKSRIQCSSIYAIGINSQPPLLVISCFSFAFFHVFDFIVCVRNGETLVFLMVGGCLWGFVGFVSCSFFLSVLVINLLLNLSTQFCKFCICPIFHLSSHLLMSNWFWSHSIHVIWLLLLRFCHCCLCTYWSIFLP